MARPLLLLSAVVALVCAGCGSEPPAAANSPAQAKPPAAGTSFVADDCGIVTGLVTWHGPLPEVAPVAHGTPRPNGAGVDFQMLAPGNAPHIDHFTRGVGGAVVYLREVNTAQAKAWNLPPVEVEFRDRQIVVKQGARAGRTGFVRRGDAVTFVSRESHFNSLRGRGAAFFALPFPDPDAPLVRTFDTCGRVALTSAAGFYWQAADLFVCDHPYYAVTDDTGRFQFAHVPAGRYDLVVWHPNWLVARTDRNPESTLPYRWHYAPPLETSRAVFVVRGRSALANLTLPK